VPEHDLETGWAAASSAAAHVLHAGSLDDELLISGADGHHLERVRRLRPGELVTASDGDGTWREYHVEDSSRGTLALRASGDLRVEPRLTPPLSVAFALTKGGKPDAVAARLTELGVDRLLPVVSARSVVRWKHADRDPRERLTRVTREAAMQSRRARLPVIEPVGPLAALAGSPGLVVADREGVPAADLPEAGPEGWLLVIGPEGGLEPGEIQDLGPCPRVGVGPHVLRAETAAVAVAGALSSRRSPAGYHGVWPKPPGS
jgi:16S rRNA (uracil1498-N3)-methyltransferase